jgi:D-amino-acid dehydrogenase
MCAPQPDDLPIIGPVARWDNVMIASGHGTLGITLAPATGRVIVDLVLGSPERIDASPFLPSRFGV